MLANRRIHLCISGGVAAYKAVEVARGLIKAGAVVQVAMTSNAQAFVGPLTFQAITHRPVLTKTLDPSEEMAIGHIEFAQACDALVVVPATANIIGKAACGIGDEVVSTILLAANVPVFIAPSMNTFMYENQAVQENILRLKARGWHLIEPGAGELACGQVGLGRLAEPTMIVEAVRQGLNKGQKLIGKRVVIAAGPTREAIDPVRFLSNPSSGRTGFALAVAAVNAGATVTLIHGPVGLPIPHGVEAVSVISAQQMHAAVMSAAQGADVVVMTAAVADYRPGSARVQKRKKTAGPWTLELIRNPDILADLGSQRSGTRPILIGYAAETGDPIPAAHAKLAHKKVDLIVANDVSSAVGFGTPDNQVTLVTANAVESLPLMSKMAIAQRLVEWMASELANV